MEEKRSTLSSSSSCIEPIDAVPLRWYHPAVSLASQDSVPSSSSFTDQSCLQMAASTQASSSWLSLGSLNQTKKDSEILQFGVKIKASSSYSSPSVATVGDRQFVQNQNQSQGNSCDSRKGFLLFGVWISTEEAPSEIKKIKKRPCTLRLFKKTAAKEVAGSYKENMGALLAEKVLTKSDIDQSSRLLLPSETVEKCLLPILNESYHEAKQHCKSSNGIRMEIFDADTGNSYYLVLKRWSTKSYVFTGNWKKFFVKRRNLKEEDQVGLFWDQNQRRFNFSVKQIRS